MPKFFYDSFLLIILSLESSFLLFELVLIEFLRFVVDGALYCSAKFLAGGQANVLLGIVLGIGSLDMNGSFKISSKVGLFDGSRTKIF
jgi:hypothetical protein